MLRVGDWRVNPTSGEISRNGETLRLEARTLRLLLCLAEHSGQVVSIDDLLDQVWSGSPSLQTRFINPSRRFGARSVTTPSSPHTSRRFPDLAIGWLRRSVPGRISQAKRLSGNRKSFELPPGLAQEPDSSGPAASRLALRSSLFSWCTPKSRKAIHPSQRPLLRGRQDPSPCCHFST